jgi:hypothetical protein
MELGGLILRKRPGLMECHRALIARKGASRVTRAEFGMHGMGCAKSGIISAD